MTLDPMDFFQHQDDARRRSGRLVALFIVAVLLIIAAIYAVVAIFIVTLDGEFDGRLLLNPSLLVGVSVVVIAVVASGSLFKVAQLSGGGESVATSLGGRPLGSDTTDPDERKLMNVVEEMAIASGVPVPPVFILDNESGINAFAAGYSPNRAVIGVTRGCMERLSRAELQGVIAHEFSHILNGDMRLNIRLIGVLHGILIIGLIGYHIMRVAAHSGRHRSSRNRGNPLPLIALGAAIMAIGFIGTFFGRLIKAGVSRQREYLADAAAVQFTREPDGLAGALRKVGGATAGSRVVHPAAEQLSHMFFAQGLHLASLFATHPPLPDRVRRIDPSWDGRFLEVAAPPRVAPAAGTSMAERIRAARERSGGGRGGAGDVLPPPAATAIGQVGRPSLEHLVLAAAILESISDPLRVAAHDPQQCRAVIYALLVDREPALRRQQLERLRDAAGEPMHDLTLQLLPQVDALDRSVRLPLIDLAVPALRRMSPTRYAQFRRHVADLVQADERVDLFEWTLHRVLQRHLAPQFEEMPPPRVRHSSLREVLDEVTTVVSALAHAGQGDAAIIQHSFDEAKNRLGLPDLRLKPVDRVSLREVDAALDTLAEASPGVKKRLIEAAAVCIMTDTQVSAREGELLRAICDSLDCPMPPLLPDQPLA
jgi:Zn-dependent protease with chaperone function